MKRFYKYFVTVAACITFALPNMVAAQAASAIPPSLVTPDKVESRIGTLEFKDGAPTVATAEKVYDTLAFPLRLGPKWSASPTLGQNCFQ